MKNGIICLGVDKLDYSYYKGKLKELEVCNRDAKGVYDYFTKKFNFSSKTLLLDASTRPFLAQLDSLASSFESGDLLIIYYSGHGGQVTDVSGDEDDKLDETWCFHDRQLIDDEIYLALSKFKTGVNILVLSDSCHSGSVVRAREDEEERDEVYSKKVGHEKSQDLFKSNEIMHENLANIPAIKKDELNPHVILLSGCQDDQSSYTGHPYSQFTKALLGVLTVNKNQVNLKDLYKGIREILDDFWKEQTPNFLVQGKLNPDFVETPLADMLKGK